MKKSFLLGMIAVSAISLTNCAKQMDIPSEAVAEGVPFEIVVGASTKTTISGMQTSWAADDSITLFHAVTGTAIYGSNDKFTAQSEGASTSFKGTLTDGALEAANSYDWYAVYPYNSFYTTPANTDGGRAYIGSRSDAAQSQTGVGSTAHLSGKNYPLYGKAENVAANTTPTISMKPAFSVIEVEVTNGLDSEINVNQISFGTGATSIVGNFYIDFSGDAPSYTDYTYVAKTATLNVTGGTIAAKATGKFYLAIKPFTTSSETITVGVTAENGKQVFTKTISSTTTFAAGKKNTLSLTYNKVASETPVVADGDYVIVASGGSPVKYYALSSEADDKRLAYVTLADFTSSNTSYMTDNNSLVWTITKSGSVYHIKAKDTNKYINWQGEKTNGAFVGETAYDLNIVESKGTYQIKSTVNDTDGKERILAKNTTAAVGFAFYTGSGYKNLYIVPIAADTRTPLVAPQNVIADVVAETPNAIEVVWDAVEGAANYTVSISPVTVAAKTVEGTNTTFEGLNYGTEYTVTVIANPLNTATNKPSAPSETTEYSTVTTRPRLATPVDLTATAEGSDVTVTWTAVANAGSYYVTCGGNNTTVTEPTASFNGLANDTYPVTVYAIPSNPSLFGNSEVASTSVKVNAGGSTQYYVKVTSAPEDWSGEYLIVYETTNVAFDGSRETLDAASNYFEVSISSNKIEATPSVRAKSFTIASYSEGYSIQAANGKYIGGTSGSNKLNAGNSEYLNTLSIDSGNAHIVSNTSVLRYNSTTGNYRFRYFRSDSYTGQKAIQLYKLAE